LHETRSRSFQPETRRINSKGRQLDPRALLDAAEQKIDWDLLDTLTGRSLTSARQLDRNMLVELCKLGALLELTEIGQSHPLDGKTVITAFFEASTRTRLSFESAAHRLDAKVVSVPDARNTGVAKGEALEDIGEMFNSYGDLVIMRHTETDSIERVQECLMQPLINAGNGSGEHPTQALADWYALLKWRPDLLFPTPRDRPIHLGVIGTPGSMRAVKSFVLLTLLFEAHVERITVVSEMADPLGLELQRADEASSIPIETCRDLGEVLPDLDVVYMNSIAFLGDSYRDLDKSFRLHADSGLKPDAVVMHPLARKSELDRSLDDTEHNLYFAQAAGAVFVRQALLVSVLGRLRALPDHLHYLTS
jgi:aspartate carbamoyltransferase catalytic subunit